MGLLSNIEKEQPKNTASEGSGWPHIALRVTGYDTEKLTTTGVNIKTGETLTIRLDNNNAPGRENVDIWSLPRYQEKKNIVSLVNPKAVVPGDEETAGVIIFEACRPGQDGLLEARWATTASHAAIDAIVVSAFVRPIPTQDPKQLHQSMGIEVVVPSIAAPVKTIDDIKERIHEIVSKPFCSALVRVQDEDGLTLSENVTRPFTEDIKALEAQVNKAGADAQKAGKPFNEVRRAKSNKRKELAEEFAIAANASIEKAVPDFFNFKNLGKALGGYTQEQLDTLKMEVMQVQRIYPGDKYKDALNKEGSVDFNTLRRDFTSQENGHFGFGSAFVALRIHDEGGTQFTKLRIDSTRPLLYSKLEELPSPNIEPQVAPIVSRGAMIGKKEEVEPTDASADNDKQAANDGEDRLAGKLAAAARGFGRM